MTRVISVLSYVTSAASVTAKTLLKTTATQGQTVFTAPTYVQGNNSLEVFINGQRQFVADNYTETSTTSFTFTSGVNLSDVIYAVVITIA